MKGASEMVLKMMLNALSEEERAHLTQFLAKDQRERLETLPLCAENGLGEFSLDQVHWSWFIPTLKCYPAKDRVWFLAALDKPISKQLSQSLKISATKEAPSQLGKEFLRQVLTQSLFSAEDQLLPMECLPSSTLNRLLTLSKSDLMHFVDFLSLYDLAIEMKQIVETKTLKKVSQALSEAQKKFIKGIVSHRDPFPTPRLGLDRWDGEEKSLHLLLHRRGLMRLGKGLAGQNRDLVWYLAHQFDIGRGHLLLKLSEEEVAPSVSEVIHRQIEEILANPEILK